MCTPLTIAALAITAAGSYAQAKGQKEAQDAQQSAVGTEMDRQDAFQKQSMGYFNNSLSTMDKGNQDTQLQTKTDARAKAYTDAIGDYDADANNPTGVSSAPKVVTDAYADKVGGAINQDKMLALKKAFLDAWGDNNLANGQTIAQDSQRIGTIGNFEKGSLDVLPVEMAAAQNKGQGWRDFGSLLTSAGQVMGMAAGTGGFGNAATGPTALGEQASQMGMGPFDYTAPLPGTGGGPIYSIDLPATGPTWQLP